MKKKHPVSSVIRDISSGINMRKKNRLDYANMIVDVCFTSTIQTTSVTLALKDEQWIKAMQEELHQFKRNQVSELIQKPADYNTMGTKWIFKNKIDEMGNVTQNKAQLIAQGYSQIKGVDFGETFAPVARLEFIRLLLGLACFRTINLYQMNVKSTFLNGFITKEVQVA